MSNIELFPTDQIIGVFRGFTAGGLEFHADLVLPYRNEFQSLPMHGQFLLIQLETQQEAVLGRITSFSSEGKLSSGAGEEFNIRAVREDRPVPEDLREQYLKYRVNIRVLGVLRNNTNGTLTFVASHRRLPHVGSRVAFPSREVLREIAGHNEKGAAIGHFALGEYIYAEGSDDIAIEDWMQIKSPEVLVNFPIESLVARRSFIFARAGFGKSNLNKLLFSKLYEQTPTVIKRNRKVPVGTVIFDPDGEYFWPDDKGRPGLCDVPKLTDKLVVFTSREGPSEFYQSFVAGGIKLDIRRLRPADVIGIALGPERQDQQNVRKLRGLDPGRWRDLVNLIDRDGNLSSLDEICRILDLDPTKQEIEALAARSNMTNIVRQLHDRSSQLMDMLIEALSKGKLCVVDVSQMRGGQALMLSGLILRRIFDRNQQEFTAAEPNTIPTIAVVEEAQAVLNENAVAAEPYISWVKEGRKYDLGAVLVTQQPGSIPMELLSQGDNWFIFHLLSAADLANVKRANAHFSEDLLSSLLNEPIPGQGVFWSSVSGKPYPISIRARSFEKMYRLQDPKYDRPAADTFAESLRAEFQEALEDNRAVAPIRNSYLPGLNGSDADVETDGYFEGEDSDTVDVLETIESKAIEALRQDKLIDKIKADGVAWGTLKAFFLQKLPLTVDDRDNFAFSLVPKALTTIFGKRDEKWHSYQVLKADGKKVLYAKVGRRSSS
ncbi:hypothetical protein IAD21_02996 [Abditibacteriota bacterium]|nr:hypothetical protein IAD21_02996 [Abditibacteriota bacterium]